MAVKFHPLPVEDFPDRLRPAISRLNFELRDLFGLEGTITSPLITRRSDVSVVRKSVEFLNQTKITNITQISEIERSASLGTAPAKSIFKVLAGPPDELFVSMQDSSGTWQWVTIVCAP